VYCPNQPEKVFWIRRISYHKHFFILFNYSCFAVNNCRKHRAFISFLRGLYAIFVTNPNPDLIDTNLFRITAKSLRSGGCSADVCNWLMLSLVCGKYFSWCSTEKIECLSEQLPPTSCDVASSLYYATKAQYIICI